MGSFGEDAFQDSREVELLREAGCPENVIRHIFAVTRLALRIASKCGNKVDTELVRKGALLHDIGRSRSHGLDHAVIGAQIARQMGVAPAVVEIIKNHIGAGITREESAELGLPVDDYLPNTPEQKIVAYADNLIAGERETDFQEALERFKKMLGNGHPAVQRFIDLHEEIESWKTERAGQD